MKSQFGCFLGLAIYALLYYAATVLGHEAAHQLLAAMVFFTAIVSTIVASIVSVKGVVVSDKWLPSWLEMLISAAMCYAFFLEGWWFSIAARSLTSLMQLKISQAPVLDPVIAVVAPKLPDEAEARVEAIKRHLEVKAAGYAGMLPGGPLVDRRDHPEALPIPANSLLGVPEPLPVDGDDF